MTRTDLNVCLLPMRIAWGDKASNLDTFAEALSTVHPETDLVVVPECFSTGFPSGVEKDDVRHLAERNTGKTIDFIKALAAKYGFAIAGSYMADSGGSLYNRAFFIEPGGEEYFADKRHLFAMAGEQKVFSQGHGRMSLRFRGWQITMIVCYDIRFPVWCRNVGNEYDLMLAVANWPKARVGAWETLLKARAIENEAYVCGVNCEGTDNNGYEYGGESAIIDFKGRDVSKRTSSVKTEGMTPMQFLYAQLSREKLDRFREKFPAYKDADIFRIIN